MIRLGILFRGGDLWAFGDDGNDDDLYLFAEVLIVSENLNVDTASLERFVIWYTFDFTERFFRGRSVMTRFLPGFLLFPMPIRLRFPAAFFLLGLFEPFAGRLSYFLPNLLMDLEDIVLPQHSF
jgi:hypothetical protein